MAAELNLINPFRRKVDGTPGAEPLGGRTTQTTGRFLALMPSDALDTGVNALNEVAGLTVARAAEFDERAVEGDVLNEAGAIVFDDLAVAVINADPEQQERLGTLSTENGILMTEPERVVYAIGQEPLLPAPSPIGIDAFNPSLLSTRFPAQYLQGYRDALSDLVERATSQETTQSVARPLPETSYVAASQAEVTWGLQATRVPDSPFTGRGVRVAILDTGLDLEHPDFAGRNVSSRSFVANEEVQDRHGHGTYCAGTACGPREPAQSPRYGIASEADLYVGKVLSNEGRGTDGNILAGIQWAVANECAIVSLSLGTSLCAGSQPSFSRIYEIVARRALAAGTLIVAAAGNDSLRPDRICPVRHPANCPSIMAIGAIDAALQVASFSCGGLWSRGGHVDMAAPGVDVLSAWPSPVTYRSGDGTSIATPHVAGIAALYAEAYPEMRGGTLGWLLLQNAVRLEAASRDVGVGIPMAPTEAVDAPVPARRESTPRSRRRTRKP